MLRILRLLGILLFAILIGIAAGRLYDLHQDGTLSDRYNSQRKADITLLVVSMIGLVALGIFESYRRKNSQKQQGYGAVNQPEEPKIDKASPTSIYHRSESVDAWNGHRIRTSRSKNRKDAGGKVKIWMGLLRIYCLVLPIIYLYILVNYLVFWLPAGAGVLVFTLLFPLLFLISILTSVGLLYKKMWGIKLGYVMVIFHLLIFPVGTFMGLVLLIGLVGASSEFLISTKEYRRLDREARRKKPQHVVI